MPEEKKKQNNFNARNTDVATGRPKGGLKAPVPAVTKKPAKGKQISFDESNFRTKGVDGGFRAGLSEAKKQSISLPTQTVTASPINKGLNTPSLNTGGSFNKPVNALSEQGTNTLVEKNGTRPNAGLESIGKYGKTDVFRSEGVDETGDKVTRFSDAPNVNTHFGGEAAAVPKGLKALGNDSGAFEIQADRNLAAARGGHSQAEFDLLQQQKDFDNSPEGQTAKGLKLLSQIAGNPGASPEVRKAKQAQANAFLATAESGKDRQAEAANEKIKDLTNRFGIEEASRITQRDKDRVARAKKLEGDKKLSSRDLKDRLDTIEDPARKEAFSKAVGLLGGDSPTRAHMEEANQLSNGLSAFVAEGSTGSFDNPFSRGDNPQGFDSLLTKGKIALDADGNPAPLDEDGNLNISVDGVTYKAAASEVGDAGINALSRFFLKRAKDELAEKPRGL